ncbi:hypothetical protein EDB83DRAFT_753455 [Lactarius deliciosus]|nr:hypothetical protein EDB83DRAFT_753455 [Lactarius deliciosus]
MSLGDRTRWILVALAFLLRKCMSPVSLTSVMHCQVLQVSSMGCCLNKDLRSTPGPSRSSGCPTDKRDQSRRMSGAVEM